jgi:HAD superfamily hydrolase (TIGR01549 family)
MTPTTSPRRGVLFDIDGTLVDTNYPHVLAWWHAFRAAGYTVAMSDIHRKVGMGADLLVAALIGSDDERVATGHRHFYAPHLEQLQPFPAAAELMRAAAGLGLEVLLASSAESEEVDALTAALGADDVVSAVTSSADAEASKPEPDILEAALAETGLRAADCVLVGDTVWDVEAATKAGMPCVAVLSGGISATELRDAGAVEIYDNAADLLNRIEHSALGRLARDGSR